MTRLGKYTPEFVLLGLVALLAIAGFWNTYFGESLKPTAYHHLHVIANFSWIFLLFWQLILIGGNNYKTHRRMGLTILIAAPLLVASTALLSVYSANKGITSGRGDPLMVQNVAGTLELGFLILLAFVLRKRRKLHGSLLLSTTLLFMGIALFFTLSSFVPGFKVEGPETLYRFQKSGFAGALIVFFIGVIFFIKDFRNGWPFLLAGSFLLLNEVVRSLLNKNGMYEPLTELVGSMSQTFTFIGVFVFVSVSLAATGIIPYGRERLA